MPHARPRVRKFGAALALLAMIGTGWPVAPVDAATTLPTTIYSVPYYRSLIGNGIFPDAQSHWAAEALATAGVHGWLRADGNGQIHPDSTLNNRDALLAIASLAGWMPEVQTPQAQAAPAGSHDPWSVWGQQVVTIAAQKGILPQGTTVAPIGSGPGSRGLQLDAPVSREQLTVWLSKAIPLQPIYGLSQAHSYQFADWNQLTPDNVPWIEAALQQNLLNGRIGEDGAYRILPAGTITRAEAATLLSRALRPMLELQKRPVIEGIVTDIESVDLGTGTPNKQRVHLIGPLGEKTSLELAGPSPRNPFGQNLAVWKKRLVDGYAFEVGDAVELYPLAPWGDNAAPPVINPDAAVTPGSAADIQKQQSSDPNINPNTNEAQMTGTTASETANGTTTAGATGIGTATAVPVQIYFARVLPPNPPMEGILMQYDAEKRQLVLQDSFGSLRQARVSPAAVAWVDGVAQPFKNIPNGTYIRAQSAGDTITAISAELPVPEPGAIPAESIISEGSVLEVQSNAIRVADSQGREGYYPFASDIIVRKGNQLASLNDIEVGDPVSLRFSDYRAQLVSAIEIPVYNRRVEAVYRGTISALNPVTQTATVRAVQRFDGGDWISPFNQMQVRLHPLETVALEGRVMAKKDFMRYGKGQEVLFSAANRFDGVEASRLTTIQGRPQIFNDTIDNVNVLGGSVRLFREGSTMSIDNNTIVLRNGRLGDIRTLKNGDAVWVLADVTRTGYRIAFLNIDTDLVGNNADDNGLLQGDIFEIDEKGQVKIAFYSRFRNNGWERASGSNQTMTVRPVPDTMILDFRGVTNNLPEVPISEFLRLGPSGFYDQAHVYTYIQDGRPIAMTLFPAGTSTDTAPTERTTLGRIASIDPIAKTITFQQVRDWTDFQGRWQPNPIRLTVLADKTMIIDHKKQISFTDLRVGDTCMVIRKTINPNTTTEQMALYMFRQ
ncbi:hypothetical protein [Heliophilum fasciatum]|uniref:SLH domain-containing protein n=1 Tax=Heliophilum fasciatum TaxID=35700 RepID=A0A4R2RRX1_9FIRM|nr:hypothetical protein [Heliophilum fasciatum]MCW2277462.1 hypothetical protein [Heliophilum fasciatum]TCP65247.1 hypothetical protein EDD73_106131 [Heliophilum fasciatum]